YYKAFWADPPACTVGEPRACYRGERSFPLVLQNVHRYFLYLALLLLVVLSHDVWKAMWFADSATGRTTFGVGVGTLVLATNVVLLAGYTLGCHSLRHLVGGGRDEISRVPLCQRAYDGVSVLNRWHHRWGWPSLVRVAFTDLYVRMLATGLRHLDAWAAVFVRTPAGRILQRNFGGHRYPRLAHVGDRTGLEMIRTLRDRGVHQGMDVHMECTVTTLLQDEGRVVGAVGFDRQ